MSQDEMAETIRLQLEPAKITRLLFEHDELAEEVIAKVYVTHDQLDLALGENGVKARSAAMGAGITVEIILDNQTTQSL